jgi:hypothetical protein
MCLQSYSIGRSQASAAATNIGSTPAELVGTKTIGIGIDPEAGGQLPPFTRTSIDMVRQIDCIGNIRRYHPLGLLLPDAFGKIS